MSPIVHRARGIESAASAHGHVVVIDVLRAFTTAAYAFASGVERIVLVASAEEAFALRARMSNAVLVGEHEGRKITGFDHGNSPAEIARTDLHGKVVVLRSSSGTQGAMLAARADTLLLGSLVVASATARAARAASAEIHIVALGAPNSTDIEEDEACADLLASLIEARTLDQAEIAERVRSSPAARRGFDPAVEWISREDVEHALAIDQFDFAMLARREGGRLIARAQRLVS